MVKQFVMVAAFAALGAGCATAGAAPELSEEAAERLAAFQPTGETRSCLSVSGIRSIDPLDEWRFLVRATGGYYLVETSGRCNGAGRPGNRLQYTIPTGQLCRNEIITVVDNLNGFTVGSCGMGDFQALEPAPEQ